MDNGFLRPEDVIKIKELEEKAMVIMSPSRVSVRLHITEDMVRVSRIMEAKKELQERRCIWRDRKAKKFPCGLCVACIDLDMAFGGVVEK